MSTRPRSRCRPQDNSNFACRPHSPQQLGPRRGLAELRQDVADKDANVGGNVENVNVGYNVENVNVA